MAYSVSYPLHLSALREVDLQGDYIISRSASDGELRKLLLRGLVELIRNGKVKPQDILKLSINLTDEDVGIFYDTADDPMDTEKTAIAPTTIHNKNAEQQQDAAIGATTLMMGLLAQRTHHHRHHQTISPSQQNLQRLVSSKGVGYNSYLSGGGVISVNSAPNNSPSFRSSSKCATGEVVPSSSSMMDVCGNRHHHSPSSLESSDWLKPRHFFDQPVSEQPSNLLHEILLNVFSFTTFEEMLTLAATCRFWQLISRQIGSCHSVEFRSRDSINRLLSLSPQQLHNILNRRVRSCRKLVITPEAQIDQMAQKNIPRLLKHFQGLQILEINSTIPYLTEEIHNLLTENAKSLRFVDFSAGYFNVSAEFPALDFSNLVYLRACDDWWRVDFLEGFKCDQLLYLGVRPLPNMMRVPRGWKSWLRRLRRLRRLIVLVDGEDDAHGTDGMWIDDSSEQRSLGGGVSSFAVDLLENLDDTLGSLVELRLLDYSQLGERRSLEKTLRLMEAGKLPSLKELSVAAPFEDFQDRLGKMAFERDENTNTWEDSAVFRKREDLSTRSAPC